MNILLLLVSFNWFVDYPNFSDPIVATSGVIEEGGTIKSDLLVHYTQTESLITYELPFDIRMVPLDNLRFGFRIPFIWRYPKGTAKRVGLGDIAMNGAYQLFDRFGDFLSLGGMVSLPTTSDTLHPADSKLRVKPYFADAYVWKFLALFFDFGVSVPVYDAHEHKFKVELENSFYHFAVRAKPVSFAGLGVEYENQPSALIPNCCFYLNDNWDVDIGLVLPFERDSARTLIAGIRFRL